VSGGQSDAATRRHGDAATRAQGDAATRGHGDAATRPPSDAATRGHGDAATGACVGCGDAAFRVRYTGSDRLYHTTDKLFQVVECAGCGLLRLDPQPSPAELAAYYPPSYWFAPDASAPARMEEAYRRLVLSDHVRFVAQALHEDGPVLDVGCGGGLFLRLLRERGHRVIGLDSSAAAAFIAWRQNGVPAVCGSLENAPLAPRSCAAITMFHVLEHVPDPRPYLRAARDLLRPQGRLIVQVPNAACWQLRLLGRRWNGLDVPRHLHDFRARDLEALLASCGFAVVRRKHFSLRDNPAGLATSIAPSLDPMARRVRRSPESAAVKIAKDAVYFALTVAALPLAALEAAVGAGSTIMLEARVIA